MGDRVASQRELTNLKDELMAHIRDFPDFPKHGVLFRDIMPLFRNTALLNKLCLAIADHVRFEFPVKIDAVAGLEARGFLFGPQVAMALNVPFIPIRKKGKLPGPTLQAKYGKEYGQDAIEIQADAISAGAKVLIVDDVLATGGTMQAAIELIRHAGGDVLEAFCLMEMKSLNGRAAIKDKTPVYTLITYD